MAVVENKALLEAREHYNKAFAEYDEIVEKFQLGQVDKSVYDEALEAVQQARAELEAIRNSK